MIEAIFDILANGVVFLIGMFMGCAYSLYLKVSKKVNVLEQATSDSLAEINSKLEMVNMKLDLNFPHFHQAKAEERPKKRKPGRPPKAIEMKNPQQ